MATETITETDLGEMENLLSILYNQALKLAKEGKLIAARDKLITVLEMNPGMVDAHIVLGKVYAQREEYDNAVKCWETVAELDPGNSTAEAALVKVREILAKRKRRLWLSFLPWVAIGGVLIIIGTVLPGVVKRFTPEDVQPAPVNEIRNAFGDNAAFDTFGIEVTSADGIVYLRGAVDTEEQKQLAAALASSNSNGFKVDASEIKVSHPQWLAESFEGLLMQIESGRFGEIEVSQNGTTLTMKGMVANEADKSRLAELAGSLIGVSNVDTSQVRLKPGTAYTIRLGETLWDLAGEFYGNHALWTIIKDANPGCPGPKNIPVGTVLTIPTLESILDEKLGNPDEENEYVEEQN